MWTDCPMDGAQLLLNAQQNREFLYKYLSRIHRWREVHFCGFMLMKSIDNAREQTSRGV